MGKVIGIDLGTTNSVVAFIEATQPVVIPNSDGLRTTPSIVAYTKNKELLVGQIAKRQKIINAANTFFSVKRFIGAGFNELSKEDIDLPYEVIQSGDTIKIKCTNLDTVFSPEEISAQIVRKLASEAETYTRQEVTEAVITVPAYFNDSQRRATKDAGKIGGLNVLRIINEPTAASLAYGLDKSENQRILVFDFGGGTFDVSILEVGNGIFEVLSTSGDTRLGGDHFDQKLVSYLLDNFKETDSIDLRNDVYAVQRVTEAAEKAKISLSTLDEVFVNIPFIAVVDGTTKHLEKTITREFFDELCSDIIDRCRVPVESALSDANLSGDEIDHVVLVGGSTRIPAIQRLIKTIVDKEIFNSINPDEVVAIGAAIQGGILAGEIRDLLLLDVTPLSLGIETLGAVMTKILPRNTTVPTRKFESFSTSSDNQTNVDIHILQGEREFAADNKSLGRFKLDGIPPAPRGVPKIDVSFDIDNNNILLVSAQDKVSGKEESLTVSNSSRLSETDVERMVEEAEKFASADKEKRETVDLKNQADSLCFEATKLMNENKDQLGEETCAKLKDAIDLVRKDISEDDIPSLKTHVEELKAIIGANAQSQQEPGENNQ